MTPINFPIKIFGTDKVTMIQDEHEFRNFAASYKLLYAAGGIVQNEMQEILMIYRRGFWDFPKGKIEEQESPVEAALREVKEETGLKHIETGKCVTFTFHTYEENGEAVLKQTCWFSMLSSVNQLLTPQVEEEITQIEWVKKEVVRYLLEDSFASLLDLWKQHINVKIPHPQK